MKYKASLDSTSKMVTALVSILFVSISLFQLFLFVEYRTWPAFAVSLLLIAIYAIIFGYHPVSYGIKDKKVVVHRYVSDVVLLRSDIKNIELIDRQN